MIELLICTLGCAISLATEHLVLWDNPWRLRPPITYMIGMLTIIAWFSLFCWLVSPIYLFFGVALLLLSGGAGLVVILGYWLRKVFSAKDQAAFTAGQLSRSVPEPLTQDFIDTYGQH
ncbi:hypothetical protein [Herpetosiphon sp. NSE202]|uniref:hypothetical protein n=1 Tax=Herpetosiphon sp. NSE202 TaxID=3351349 RepID=UPI00362D30D6